MCPRHRHIYTLFPKGSTFMRHQLECNYSFRFKLPDKSSEEVTFLSPVVNHWALRGTEEELKDAQWMIIIRRPQASTRPSQVARCFSKFVLRIPPQPESTLIQYLFFISSSCASEPRWAGDFFNTHHDETKYFYPCVANHPEHVWLLLVACARWPFERPIVPFFMRSRTPLEAHRTALHFLNQVKLLS